MVILGIDPGSRATGIAVLSGSTLLFVDALNLDALTEQECIDILNTLVIEYGVTQVCMECQPSGGQGHAATWASKHLKRCLRYAGVSPSAISELYPQQWRRKLGMWTRKASGDLKKQSVEFVAATFGVVLKHDIAEAACLARAFQLCCEDD